MQLDSLLISVQIYQPIGRKHLGGQPKLSKTIVLDDVEVQFAPQLLMTYPRYTYSQHANLSIDFALP
jgi:hypothetical protein